MKLIDLQEDMEVMKRHAALHKWKQKFRKTATYLNFLNACMRAKNVPLAERMLDLLNEHLKGKSNVSTRLVESDEQFYLHAGKTDEQSILPRLTSPLRKAQENEDDFLSLSQTSISSRGSVGSSGLGDWLPIDQRIEELKMKYRSTLETLSDHFKSRVSAEALQKKLSLLPPELKSLKGYVQITSQESESTFEELVAASHYRHTEILQELVRELGDSNSKKAMSLYSDDLQTFNGETILKELPGDWPGWDHTKGYDSVTLHMGDRWEMKTLHDFEELKRRIQKKAHFGFCDLLIQKVEHACLSVVLAVVSTSADLNNFKLIDPQFFKLNSVLRVAVGEDIIYHVESPKVCQSVYEC